MVFSLQGWQHPGDPHPLILLLTNQYMKSQQFPTWLRDMENKKEWLKRP